MKFPLVVMVLLFSLLGFGAGKSTAKKSPEPKVETSEAVDYEEPAPLKIVLPDPSLSWTEKLQNKAFINRRAYLDLEDNQVQSVFNMPGRDWYTCQMDKDCKPVAWPDNDTDIEVTSNKKKMRVYDYRTNEYVDQEFVQVNYKYDRASAKDSKEKGAIIHQEGTGWIDAAYLTNKKRAAFFSEKPEKNISPICKDDRFKKNLKDIEAAVKVAEKQGINEVADAVKKVTGQCVIDPRQKKRRFEKGNIYDNYVMPTVLKQKVPKIKKEDGTYMTSQDLVDIDSLARSMYGEMAGCFKNGLQYPMAVAKIVQNRSEASDRAREFIKGDHDDAKSPLSKVVTSKSQFNVWMAKHGDKMNPSLTMALCPPSDPDKMYYKGTKPTKYETDIWDNAIRIATQTVVQPKKFKQRTSQVSGFFYTSGMGKFYGMKQVFPEIEDRKVEHNACLEVWVEKKKDPATKDVAKTSKNTERAPSSKKGKK